MERDGEDSESQGDEGENLFCDVEMRGISRYKL